MSTLICSEQLVLQVTCQSLYPLLNRVAHQHTAGCDILGNTSFLVGRFKQTGDVVNVCVGGVHLSLLSSLIHIVQTPLQ